MSILSVINFMSIATSVSCLIKFEATSICCQIDTKQFNQSSLRLAALHFVERVSFLLR